MPTSSFNPHPANWPGDARLLRYPTAQIHVSIRTRPIGRVMPIQHMRDNHALAVSIRTRPIGRVMHGFFSKAGDVIQFQSAPGQLAG
ncbi:hypothetical protein SFMTTN_2957 [Sulfuriferula multivorans]|uniref:Uncharacterized protein n=1 Tax=Sulfuriferula multivorans TaxID=1559896 RepID=A0A401JZR3_9PROT|nr:hypothetical protein SFMTTN_2957 [Sulfuriferula multivorans]